MASQSKNKWHSTAMPTECRLDLGLMMKFLDKAHDGIDMNLLSFRRPTHINRSDSCGFAWRFELQPGLRFWASNNLLKFMASIISPWIDILAGRFNCALSMTDSTMSAGWIRKTNFKMDNVDPIEASTRIWKLAITPHIHRVWHKGVLTVVQREEESSRRCPLLRVRTIGLWPH